MSQPRKFSDSPWFWMLAFSLTAALLVNTVGRSVYGGATTDPETSQQSFLEDSGTSKRAASSNLRRAETARSFGGLTAMLIGLAIVGGCGMLYQWRIAGARRSRFE